MGGGDFSTLLSGFHNKTHTPKFFIRPTKKCRRERREETPAEKRKVGAFLGRRGKPLDARRSKKEKRNGETKKKCMSLRVSPKKKKRTSNKHFKKKSSQSRARALIIIDTHHAR